MSTADLRQAAADARQERAAAATALGELRTQRRLGADVPDADLIAARDRVTAATARLTAAREALRASDPVDGFRLADAQHPLLLFPVRLETRFAWADPQHPDDPAAYTVLPASSAVAPVLLVRIYPDAIHTDTHEPELTPDEVKWRAEYATHLVEARDRKDFVDAWAELIARVGARRAAYLAHTSVRRTGTARPESWSRAPRAEALPDFWYARARLAGGAHAIAASGLVRWPLEIGPDPAGWDDVAHALSPGMAWMADFVSALDAGMALRIVLPRAADGSVPDIEQLTVVGLRAEGDATEGAAVLSGLLDAHHYTDGLWLPEHGTPTNGTPLGSAPSGRPGPAEDVFQTEGDMWPLVAPTPLTETCEGRRASELLGIDERVFRHVAGARVETAPIAQRVRLLIGRAFAEPLIRLLNPILTRDDADTLIGYLCSDVEAAGPLPAVRVADQPYGILPVTLVDPGDHDQGGGLLLTRLNVLREHWLNVSLPQVGDVGAAAGDPAVDLVEILRCTETTAVAGIRPVLGPELAALMQARPMAGAKATIAALREMLADLGLPDNDADLLRLLLLPDPTPVTQPMVQPKDAPPSSVHEAVEYLRLLGFERHDLGSFGLTQLAADRDEDYRLPYGPGDRPRSLLFEIGRLAVLSTADVAARELLRPDAQPLAVEHWDDELPLPPSGALWPGSMGERLDAPSPTGTGQSVGFSLLTAPGPEAVRLWNVLSACRELARMEPEPEHLERVLRAELGLLWHRLDAWYTAIATGRLRSMRNGTAPTGIHLGGFGVVTDLRPERRLRPVPSGSGTLGRTIYEDDANGGYLHAPSLAHAVTGAVLRSAHLGHAAAGHGDAFSVDLSSARVRRGLALLDGVSQGQSLAALLGYRIERTLKQILPHGPSAIAIVRAAAPVVGGKLTPAAPGADSGLLAADNVVDGRRLLDLAGFGAAATVDRGTLAAAVSGLSAEQLDAVVAALEEAADVLDAAGDLVLAEGVYQFVQGNAVRSAAVNDAVSGTSVVPTEIEVAQTPRHGIGVTQRMAVAFPPLGADALSPASGWATSMRAAVSPIAEAYARAVLPNPDSIRLRALLTRADGTTAEIGASLARLQALALQEGRPELALGALDLTFTPVAAEPEPSGSVLELRLAEMIRLEPAAVGAAEATILLDRDPAWGPSEFDLVQTLEVCRCLRELLTEARPLCPADLGQPQSSPSHALAVAPVEAALAGARARLSDLRGRLADADAELRSQLAAVVVDGVISDDVAEIDPGPIRALLYAADLAGIPTVCPPSWTPVAPEPSLPTTVKERLRAALTQLVTLSQAAQVELTRRLAAYEDAASAERPDASAPPDAQAAGTVAALTERAEALFGSRLPLPIPLEPTTDDGRHALSSDAQPVGADGSAARQVLARTALVRAGAARLDEVNGYAELVQGSDPAFVVHQVPSRPDEAWVALPGRPLGGRCSLLASLPLGDIPDGVVAGLLVDEWVEVVPDGEQTTSLAFHYDAPTSAPPNVWLLGVLAPHKETWTADAAFDTVDEALALARMRAVSTDAVPVLGQLLPMTYGWDLNPNMPGLDVARLTEKD